MIDGKYLAGRTIKHLAPRIDQLGMKQCERRFKRISEESVSLDGIIFDFNVCGEELDVSIEKKQIKGFAKKIKAIRTSEFWEDKGLIYLRQQKDKYSQFLRNLRLDQNGSGNYHFKADLNTKSENNAFFAVLDCIIKPVLYSFIN